MRTTTLVVSLVAGTALMLTGCGIIPSGPRVIDPDHVAGTAEDALEEAYGSRFSVDCGTAGVELKAGEDVSCVATDLTTEIAYDAEVELTAVDGGQYEIEVQLDSAAEGPVEPAPGAVTVPGSDIAALAAGALAPVIGFEPTDMVCLNDDVEIVVDTVEFCGFTGEGGEVVTVQVTVTTFDESTGDYEIYAEIVE